MVQEEQSDLENILAQGKVSLATTCKGLLAGTAINLGCMVTSVGLNVAHIMSSSFLFGYENDIASPLSYYLGFRIVEKKMSSVLNVSPHTFKLINGGFFLSTYCGAELLQKFHLYGKMWELLGIHKSNSTYDPKDFLAYGVGIAAALGVDYVVTKYQERKKQTNSLPISEIVNSSA